ncbi:MAG TPA: N-acetyltransferase [Desulfurivibrionaceae bacterium]|nr:N-acetyltransferase [Desulfurivibrionaceae bacterium]
MKIRPPTTEEHPKVAALLRQAFPNSDAEAQLVADLRHQGKIVHEWVCIHTNQVIAYLALTKAYHGARACGLHVAPLAVKPDFQRQGIGSELLRFALRQAAVREQTLFVLGDPDFYQRFGFTPCVQPTCPFDKGNTHFLSLRNSAAAFTVGYEAEFFRLSGKKPRAKGKKR